MSIRPRLNGGAYEPELTLDPQHWISRYAACWRFLDSVRTRYPEVLDALDAFPHTPDDFGVLVNWSQSEPKDRARGQRALEWLQGWAREYRLESDLVLKAAVWTVCQWHSDPRARGAREWAYPGSAWRVPETALAPISPDPFTEDHAAWTTRAETLWAARVRELEEAHCTPTKRLNPQHFPWLARLVVGSESRAAIARSDGVTPQAVGKGTGDLAALIELALPKPARGRPPRTNTHNI